MGKSHHRLDASTVQPGPVRTVAIVDCDDKMRDEISNLLSSFNLSTVTFSTSSDLLFAVSGTQSPDSPQIDLLLCRLELECDQGLAVLRAIRERALSVPMAIYSTHGDVTTAVKSFHEGAVDFIDYAKPDVCFCNRVLQLLDGHPVPDLSSPSPTNNPLPPC